MNQAPCSGCGKPISENEWVGTGDASWHTNCFRCAACKELIDGDYVQKDSAPYHSDCLKKQEAPNCAKCKKPILEQSLVALEQEWHATCFVCAHCGKSFQGAMFMVSNNQPVHSKCYHQVAESDPSVPKCAVCKKAVVQGGTKAWGETYHQECFLCTVCNQPLSGGKFTVTNDNQPCHIHCWEEDEKRKAPKCYRCGEGVVGDSVEAVQRTYHPQCFICCICNESLKGGSSFNIVKTSGDPCHAHCLRNLPPPPAQPRNNSGRPSLPPDNNNTNPSAPPQHQQASPSAPPGGLGPLPNPRSTHHNLGTSGEPIPPANAGIGTHNLTSNPTTNIPSAGEGPPPPVVAPQGGPNPRGAHAIGGGAGPLPSTQQPTTGGAGVMGILGMHKQAQQHQQPQTQTALTGAPPPPPQRSAVGQALQMAPLTNAPQLPNNAEHPNLRRTSLLDNRRASSNQSSPTTVQQQSGSPTSPPPPITNGAVAHSSNPVASQQAQEGNNSPNGVAPLLNNGNGSGNGGGLGGAPHTNSGNNLGGSPTTSLASLPATKGNQPVPPIRSQSPVLPGAKRDPIDQQTSDIQPQPPTNIAAGSGINALRSSGLGHGGGGGGGSTSLADQPIAPQPQLRKRFCGDCGTLALPLDTFCGECGNKLNVQPTLNGPTNRSLPQLSNAPSLPTNANVGEMNTKKQHSNTAPHGHHSHPVQPTGNNIQHSMGRSGNSTPPAPTPSLAPPVVNVTASLDSLTKPAAATAADLLRARRNEQVARSYPPPGVTPGALASAQQQQPQSNNTGGTGAVSFPPPPTTGGGQGTQAPALNSSGSGSLPTKWNNSPIVQELPTIKEDSFSEKNLNSSGTMGTVASTPALPANNQSATPSAPRWQPVLTNDLPTVKGEEGLQELVVNSQ
eukprot:TRINITY_DN48417_c0_g1_i1.p1 TRINITY_DN48417_c0_g1~~TRINITY_DN48417_c0_g1_i1.p1  ORF type:complete len:908 (+),score=105.62 TRINITY_DN48417_c0_g1_i1:38-2725(+)